MSGCPPSFDLVKVSSSQFFSGLNVDFSAAAARNYILDIVCRRGVNIVVGIVGFQNMRSSIFAQKVKPTIANNSTDIVALGIL